MKHLAYLQFNYDNRTKRQKKLRVQKVRSVLFHVHYFHSPYFRAVISAILVFLSCNTVLLSTVCYCSVVMGRKGTPFPHLQFMAQSVPPPQIVIMLGKGTRPLSEAQT